MPLFGIDISNNNGGDLDLNQVKAEGFSFVFAKVSEGDYYRDWTWPHYRDAARAAGLQVAGYHYLRGDCDINAQADLFLDQLGDPTCPIMIDFEANSGGMATFWAFVNAVNARGRQVNLSYIPRWYWAQIGSPDIAQVPGLIQSSYVGGSGFASGLYAGVTDRYWAGFGGRNVDILQFSDAGLVAGRSVDVNAFPGSEHDLAVLLGTAAPTTSQETFMAALTDDEQRELLTKTREVWEQVRQGWPQLGTNAKGEPLTMVDAVAAVKVKVGA
jgi:GH25 family lysozyme M1 (1,4-beta-N-acetylmuramidase)